MMAEIGDQHNFCVIKETGDEFCMLDAIYSFFSGPSIANDRQTFLYSLELSNHYIQFYLAGVSKEQFQKGSIGINRTVPF